MMNNITPVMGIGWVEIHPKPGEDTVDIELVMPVEDDPGKEDCFRATVSKKWLIELVKDMESDG